MTRRNIKLQKFDQQGGKCAHCNGEMKISYSELDRKNAVDGYTIENTELVHAECHRAAKLQKATRRNRNYRNRIRVLRRMRFAVNYEL